MTLHVLAACTFALFRPDHAQYATTYIAVLVICSYFLAGVSKVLSPGWRKGSALVEVIKYSNATVPSRLAKKLQSFGNLKTLSFIVIVFELMFPLVLLGGIFTPSILVMGILFHFANYYLFGLNRFFWVWIATYPAIM